jgi:hypothetical protein
MRPLAFVSTATASLLLSTAAFAMVGGEPDRLAPGERIHRIAHSGAQDRLDAQASWQDFLARRGGTWSALWDEATGTPVRFWGTGWAVDADQLATDAGAFRLGAALLAEEHALLGDLDLADLSPRAVDRGQGITTVTWARTWRGLPVEQARVSLRFKHGRFVMGQFESLPGIDDTLRDEIPDVDPKEAFATAVDAMGWVPAQATQVNAPSPVVYPIASAVSVEYRLAWKLELSSQTTPSRRFVWVDAHTGEMLAFREQVRFLSAEVAAQHDDRYPGNGTTTSPMAHAQLEIDGLEATADGDGVFTTDATGSAVWTAGSRYFRLLTADGESPAQFGDTLTEDGQTLLAVADDDLDAVKLRRVLAQLDTSVAAHRARDRALAINPYFGWAGQRVDATVNSTEMTCNAWFDGDINFVVQADGCNNTGRVMDVVAHEYGHGFHAYSIVNGAGSFDGALSEGMGDYMAATISGDPATARGFFVGSDQPLRDIEINRVWPDDIGEIHQTGRIVAGALWDARKALVAVLGEEAGIAHADQLFWAVASRASDIPTSYVEALLADDDNGDLGDGTPNKCLIDDTFGMHGLGPAAAADGLFAIDHAPPVGARADQQIGLTARVTLSRPECSAGEVSEVLVHWSRGDEEPSTVRMDAQDLDSFALDLPGVEAGTEVRYALEVIDANGQIAGRLPQGSITDPWYAVFVGDADVIFESDFEDDDGGFTHELLVGNADSEGADDWMRGRPKGDSGDPDGAFSGEYAWGNDLQPEENWNGAYQPNVHNALTSPRIQVPEGSGRVFLQFRRWLSVEDGFFDTAELSVNGIGIWTQLAGASENDASNHHQDRHWALRTYEITDLVSADGSVQVTWDLVTDGGLQLGGWTIDDVKVFAIPDEPVDGDGFAGEGCACDAGAGGGPSGLLLLLPLFGLALRRRSGQRATIR